MFLGSIIVALSFVVTLFTTTATCGDKQTPLCKCANGNKAACSHLLKVTK